MEKDPVSKPKKSSRNAWIFIGVLILIPIIGIVIPVCMSDGTEGLSGKQKTVAIEALKPNFSPFSMDAFFDFILKTRVDRVYTISNETAESNCRTLYQPGNTYYAVDLSDYTFFGVKVNSDTSYDGCFY